MFGSIAFGQVVFAGEPVIAVVPPTPTPYLDLCQQYAIGICIGQSNPCDELSPDIGVSGGPTCVIL